MTVEQLMTRNVETCHPADSLSVAARIMWERDCGCVPVVDEPNGAARVVGMITDRDVCMAAYTQGRSLAAIDVGSAMARIVHSCRPKDSVKEAMKIMEANRLRRLPVVDQDDRLVGLLSLADAAREVARAQGHATTELTDARLGELIEAISAPRGVHDVGVRA